MLKVFWSLDMEEYYTMDGSVLLLPLSTFSRLLILSLLLSLLGITALAEAVPQLEGVLSEFTYTSPSGRFKCKMTGIPIEAPDFFIDDSSTSEFDGVSFGYGDGESFIVWIVRVQKEGWKDVSPTTSDEFPVNSKTYIPYFYSELPYEITELSNHVLDDSGESTGLLRIQFGDARQLHGYWLGHTKGWFQSVQFLPSLSSEPDGVLDEDRVRADLNKMVKRCGFISGK